MLCLGCTSCPENSLCGGLRIEAPLFDCLDLCCGNPKHCDNVCRNNPDYTGRVREIDGFALDQIPISSSISTIAIPTVIPMLYHGFSRRQSLSLPAVALPLYGMLKRRLGTPRFETREAMYDAYGITKETAVILSGTDTDGPLEEWWALGEATRRMIIRNLRQIGISLVTTPNYSLFTDVPRWNDLHSMKRIALVHHEFLSEGVASALHVNGRTETDFHRWAAYVDARPAITHLAYEFTTGTQWSGRREQHTAWLCGLATAIKRPLYLIVRGGCDLISELGHAFAGVTVIETSAFVKTMMRQRASIGTNAIVNWCPEPTAAGSPLDELLRHNVSTVRDWLSARTKPAAA
jgi:hypothetical protein